MFCGSQIAVQQSAAAVWEAVLAEAARREAEAAERTQQAAAEQALPRSKRKREPRLWLPLGSEARTFAPALGSRQCGQGLIDEVLPTGALLAFAGASAQQSHAA
jgi:hypothetical protein